jgi:hypothetical protein
LKSIFTGLSPVNQGEEKFKSAYMRRTIVHGLEKPEALMPETLEANSTREAYAGFTIDAIKTENAPWIKNPWVLFNQP